MSEQLSSLPWYAVNIRTYYHESVETSLRHKGYDVFSPTYTARRVVAGRERQFPVPLFPGYLFSSFDHHYRLPVLTIPGVIRILGTSTALEPVPTDEIEAIRRTVTSGLQFEPFDSLQPGEPVEVLRGPLAGIKGEVVYHKGKQRLVIRVTALNERAVCVEVDHTMVARLSTSTFVPAARAAAAMMTQSAQYYKKPS